MKYAISLLSLLLLALQVSAQETASTVEMADQLRADGKIYVVVAVAFVVMLGILGFLFRLDSKITKLEQGQKGK